MHAGRILELEQKLSHRERQLSEQFSKTRLTKGSERDFFRTTACGLASEIVKQELDEMGFQTQLLLGNMNHPDFLGIKSPSKQHVICQTETGDGELIIDANYSQFFAPFGLDSYLMRYQSDDPFPKERALVFESGQNQDIAVWCAEYVQYFWRNNLYNMGFQKRHLMTSDDTRNNLSFMPAPITVASNSELVDYFSNIWDLENYRAYESGEDIMTWVDDYRSQSVDNRGVYL